MSDLSRRLVVSCISVAALALLFYFAYHPFFQYIVAAVVAALSGVAIWEYEQIAKVKGGRMIFPALIVIVITEVFSFFLAAKFFSFEHAPLIVFFVGFLILFALHFREKEGAIVDLAVSSFGLLYVAVPMGMLLGILYLPGLDGRWWIIYLLTVTKITDIGAYFAGTLWGRRKLAPAISPKKTIEGALFGLGCALIASYGFYYYASRALHLSSYEWIFLGLVLGIVGQFGDLSESLLKRDANKKDSNALPGLGGVLDALDSILFNATIIYIYLYFIKL